MTPALQREALAVLAEVWGLSPDVRLGQLSPTSGSWARRTSGGGSGTSRTMSLWPSCTVTEQN